MITTERLILRQWRDSDRAPFAEMGADSGVMEFFPANLDRAGSDALVDRCRAAIDRDSFGLWAVERRSDAAFIGFTGLARVDFASPIDRDIEVGWRLARAAWGQGYASEAARAALAFAWGRADIARIVSMTSALNLRSQAVMARIGLVRRPDLDFDHPRVAPGDRLRAHIVYALDRP